MSPNAEFGLSVALHLLAQMLHCDRSLSQKPVGEIERA